MFCIHKWSMWKKCHENKIRYMKATGEKIDYVQVFQTRRCSKCGRFQREDID